MVNRGCRSPPSVQRGWLVWRFRRSYSLAAATPAITKRIVLFLPLTSRDLIECENAHLLHERA
jgi:hypothetical protein